MIATWFRLLLPAKKALQAHPPSSSFSFVYDTHRHIFIFCFASLSIFFDFLNFGSCCGSQAPRVPTTPKIKEGERQRGEEKQNGIKQAPPYYCTI
jgi:hypothetical protein